jgi:hypothetical protein
LSAAESVTVVEPERSHMVRMVWQDSTITCTCWCGWSAEITDPQGRDCVGQRRHFRDAQQLAAWHQYPDLPAAEAVDALACELWARLLDWPVDVR